jgi:hypothetical protein
VAKYPDSTKGSLEQRLRARARERWPQIASLQIRHRGIFSYVDATLTDATTLKLCRLRYVGSAHQWQFAVYRASHDDYDESVFFTGLPVGTCQDALDTACGLYLNDPTAWIQPPTNLRARPLRRAAPIRASTASPPNSPAVLPHEGIGGDDARRSLERIGVEGDQTARPIGERPAHVPRQSKVAPVGGVLRRDRPDPVWVVLHPVEVGDPQRTPPAGSITKCRPRWWPSAGCWRRPGERAGRVTGAV